MENKEMGPDKGPNHRTSLDKDSKKLLKRARKKYISEGLAGRLFALKSPLKKSYMRTLYCNGIMQKNEDDTLTTTYCKNRWCLVCNSNRIGKLIDGYKPQIDQFKDPYFITLTAETVDAKGLKNRLDDMVKMWRKIMQNEHALKRKINGIRKLECTIRPNQKYHPHFHLIVDGKENSEQIISGWLRRWGGLAHPKGQDMRPADGSSIIELFKYFTKLIVKETPPNIYEKNYHYMVFYPQRMDVIFRAMKGRRVYQSFGNVRAISEDVDEKRRVKTSIGEAGSRFKWVDVDWFETNTYEKLTGFMPSDQIKNIVYK